MKSPPLTQTPTPTEPALVRTERRAYEAPSGRELPSVCETEGARENEATIKSAELIIKTLFAQAPSTTTWIRVDTEVLFLPFGRSKLGVCRQKRIAKGAVKKVQFKKASKIKDL